MTKGETAKLFLLLGQFYPNKRPTTEQRLAWELALEPYAYEDVRAAAIAYARERKFFPDLADLTDGICVSSDEKDENAWMEACILPENPQSISHYARKHGIPWPQAARLITERKTT